jgi:hypothetical protein
MAARAPTVAAARDSSIDDADGADERSGLEFQDYGKN